MKLKLYEEPFKNSNEIILKPNTLSVAEAQKREAHERPV
jgi:hypothetical protein